jgi:hypothetical protein
MGRPKDQDRQELINKLGVSPNHKWSKKELLEVEKKQIAKQEKEAEKEALTKLIAGDLPESPDDLVIPFDHDQELDPFVGLTERQKRIARLRMRGMTQKAIAGIEKIAQPLISRELKAIKEWQEARGANIDQPAVVGSAVSLYEEVEATAWGMFNDAKFKRDLGEQAKALTVILSARDKQTKLLMDLGLIKKADVNVKVTHEVSPFLQSWRDGSAKKNLADHIVTSQLTPLAAPTPPEDEDIEDAEFEEEPTETVELEIEED